MYLVSLFKSVDDCAATTRHDNLCCHIIEDILRSFEAYFLLIKINQNISKLGGGGDRSDTLAKTYCAQNTQHSS